MHHPPYAACPVFCNESASFTYQREDHPYNHSQSKYWVYAPGAWTRPGRMGWTWKSIRANGLGSWPPTTFRYRCRVVFSAAPARSLPNIPHFLEICLQAQRRAFAHRHRRDVPARAWCGFVVTNRCSSAGPSLVQVLLGVEVATSWRRPVPLSHSLQPKVVRGVEVWTSACTHMHAHRL